MKSHRVGRRSVAEALHVAARLLDRASGELLRGAIALRVDRKRDERLQEQPRAGEITGPQTGDDAAPERPFARAASHLPRDVGGGVVWDRVGRLVEPIFGAEASGRAVNDRERGAHGVGVVAAEDGARELEERPKTANRDAEIVNRFVVRRGDDAWNRRRARRRARGSSSKKRAPAEAGIRGEA